MLKEIDMPAQPVVKWTQVSQAKSTVLPTVEIIELANTDDGERRYGFVQTALMNSQKEAIMIGWNDETYRLYIFPKWMPLTHFYDMILVVEQTFRGHWAASQLHVTSLEPDL